MSSNSIMASSKAKLDETAGGTTAAAEVPAVTSPTVPDAITLPAVTSPDAITVHPGTSPDAITVHPGTSPDAEVRITVPAASSPAGKVVWARLEHIFLILVTQYFLNGTVALLANRFRALADALPRYFWSPQGLAAPTLSLLVFLLLMKFKRQVKTAIFLLCIEAPATSVTIALFHNTDFGATLMLTAVQMTVMLTCLIFYCRAAPGQFSVMAAFFVSTMPALLALVVTEILAPTSVALWMFSSVMSIWINCKLLRETKRVIDDGIPATMPAAVHLHGYIMQHFLAQVIFLLIKGN